jgi:chemotaxis protein MotB
MFDIGSARLRDYTQAILREIAPYLTSVPNRISITGHTDIRPYPGQGGYSNWELSADRANAARRALVAAGLPDEKIARVVGLASSVLFNRNDPQNAINRRISIVIMTKQAEQDALKTDVAKTTPEPPSEVVTEPQSNAPGRVGPGAISPTAVVPAAAVPAAAAPRPPGPSPNLVAARIPTAPDGGPNLAAISASRP